MHILDMETFNGHKSSVHSSGRLLIVKLFHAYFGASKIQYGHTFMFKKTNNTKGLILRKKYLFYDMEVSITIYDRDKK